MVVTGPEPELSRPFAIAELGEERRRGAFNFSFQATAGECAGLARRFDLRALDGFAVDGALTLDRRGDLVLKGRIEARPVQSCVASLEPVAGKIDETFALVFSKEGNDLASAELPESWPGEVLDLGEIAAQQLGLALDPYPKARGVETDPAVNTGPQGGNGTHKPFSGLEGLRDRLAGKS